MIPSHNGFEKMRVLMLNYEFPPIGGGAANANKHIFDQFSEDKDLEIDLITSSKDDYKKVRYSKNITLYRLDVNKEKHHHWKQSEILKYTWKAFEKSLSLRKRKNYDLIHAWFTIPCGAIPYLAGFDEPLLISLRGSDVPGYNQRFTLQYKILKPLVKRVWKRGDRVVANSEDLKELALETSPEKDIDVISNGVDTEKFTPNYEINEKIRIICVSRLVERKGIDYLIKAIKDLRVDLEIVGKGKQEEDLKNLVNNLGLDDKVKFIGRVPHEKIPEYYRNSDIFALPSFYEGMSNSVLEALASGLPLVLTDTGGSSRLVDNNGKIVPKRNIEKLKEAIKDLMSNKERLWKMGRRSREISLKMSWKDVAERYLKTYEEIRRL
ncbi:hypothetical protein AKJ54_00360 [candidate division MSBL1 archaeon SCGC-AAA382K21]|uniref:Glycosyl transferase family 1 n=1 Tax=candidate division MSBL1 archaeon SCGC-AAA382K21 TaxID=1698283 RepID=A0A133VLL4_9EURY|nr:hypothetical protein AKJ54_00360 [candidate division MSBL1 archaeon SCGC-AAA382K21]